MPGLALEFWYSRDSYLSLVDIFVRPRTGPGGVISCTGIFGDLNFSGSENHTVDAEKKIAAETIQLESSAAIMIYFRKNLAKARTIA
jgi:hypothetical protein